MSELEKAFPASQRDSYCKKMEEAHVVSCTPCKGKGKKGVYEIVLDDSILFAEGGGQPCDQGTVAGYPCAVVRVDKARGNAVVHRSPSAPQQRWHPAQWWPWSSSGSGASTTCSSTQRSTS